MDYNKLAELLFPHITKNPEEYETIYPKRELPEGAKVTRLGPSPTGFIHLGNLFGAFADERLAHQSGGVLFLRVEDTDAKREVPGAVEVLINSLKHYSINFDEGATIEGDNGAYGPYRQRQRASIYHVYAKKLVSEGQAYPCFCTEEQLSAMREQQEANKETTGYYGKYAMWRDRSMEEIKAELEARALKAAEEAEARKAVENGAGEIKEEIREEKKMETVIKVEGMMCTHCKAMVEKVCKAVAGTEDAVVDLQAKTVTVTGEASVDALKQAIIDAGYEVIA